MSWDVLHYVSNLTYTNPTKLLVSDPSGVNIFPCLSDALGYSDALGLCVIKKFRGDSKRYTPQHYIIRKNGKLFSFNHAIDHELLQWMTDIHNNDNRFVPL